MGFISHPPQYLLDTASASQNKLFFAYEFISDPVDGNCDDGKTSAGSSIPMSILLAFRGVINDVMNELNVPIEDRPDEPLPPSRRPPPPSKLPLIDFDPFKPFIIRTSNQVKSSLFMRIGCHGVGFDFAIHANELMFFYTYLIF
jgi:hypothetical protein